ncbi:hypothetical protein SAMN05446037_101428 [Anaerovirgula multivorans]|uniref:DUF4129 domain-containing protein n=1 Tax=Anaerovirgula multivorans TaxID=312168 RepID=A0A239FT14_9FIRM|nr:hypothetical protein [Anaerovirgula multivorans]SNS59991.1 hypothetical protein SAMN05446037_101428 [Anaerovirgula multivorans]
MENNLLSHQENFKKVAEEIINSSKYMHLKEKENLWEKIAEIIERIFNRISPETYEPYNVNPIGSQNLFFVMLILLITLLLFYLIKSQKNVVKSHQRVIYGETVDQNTTYEGLYKKALHRENEGKFRHAIRLYFISVLLYMNEKSLWFLDDSKTNYEIAISLKEKGFKKTNNFKSMGDYFEYIWYGNKQIDSVNFSRYKEIAKELLLEVKNYSEKK